MKFVSHRQRGVTLFELLLVLFVAAFVAVAVATIYKRVDSTYKANSLFSDINQVIGNVRSLYAAGDYTSVTELTAVAAGLVPQSLYKSPGTATSDFKTPYVASTGWSLAGAGSALTVVLNGIPKNDCVNLAAKFASTAVGVTAGTATVTDVGSATTACSGATNVITLTY